jgi:hypothetical protein
VHRVKEISIANAGARGGGDAAPALPVVASWTAGPVLPF